MKEDGKWQEALDTATEGTGYEPDAELNDNAEMESCS